MFILLAPQYHYGLYCRFNPFTSSHYDSFTTNNNSTGSSVPSPDINIPYTVPPNVRTQNFARNESPIRATVVDIRHSTSLEPVQQCTTVQHNNTKIASTPLDEDALKIYQRVTSFDAIVDKALGTLNKHNKKNIIIR